VSQQEGTKLREGVPYVKLYRKTPKHLYPKLNGLGVMVIENCGLPSGPITFLQEKFLISTHTIP
jgi:hypothetical protein